MATAVSSKHQITIPSDAFRDAGLVVGDRLEAVTDGPGRIVLRRARDVVADLAGELTGTPAGGPTETPRRAGPRLPAPPRGSHAGRRAQLITTDARWPDSLPVDAEVVG